MSKQNNISKTETPLTWETFEEYILTEGLARYKKALENADEQTYLKLYPTLLEFIKPKIKRIEGTNNSGELTNIVVTYTRDKENTGA